MAKILVFQTPIIKQETELDVKDEKLIMFNNLSKLLPEIPKYHFKQFYNMEMDILKSKKITSHGISTIVAKELLKFLTPLIVEPPETLIIKKRENKIKKPTPIKEPKKEWALSLQNEIPINGVLYPISQQNMKKYQKLKFRTITVPPNTTFKIIGFILPNEMGVPMLDASIFIKAIGDDISVSNYEHVVENGLYKLHSTSNSNPIKGTSTFMQQFNHFEHTTTNYPDILDMQSISTNNKGSTSNKAIIFKDDKDSLEKMNIIINELQRIDEYYTNNYGSLLTTIELDFLKNKLSESRMIKYKERDPYNLNVYKISHKIEHFLKDVTPDIKVRNYSDSLYYTLQNNGALHLFNRLNILDSNNLSIKKELADFVIKNETNKLIKSQQKIRSKIQLELMKKQAITADRFGKNVMYSTLPQIKKDAVNKEYNKIKKEEEILKKDNKARDKYVLIKKFYEAFTVLDTKKALKQAIYELEKHGLGPKKSCQDNLNYGLCEHNLYRAQLILKGVNMKDVREQLIEKYCTPKTYKDTGKNHSSEKERKENILDQNNIYQPTKPLKFTENDEFNVSNDYYCNICGEQVYVKFTEDSIQFVEGKLVSSGPEADPLNDLIYQEVAKIIRNSIRFKILRDIRPVIKSVTTVLRPEIGMIETRLTRIRTNIGDDIRDLMTLYIVVYTYALLSHMIFINYGEMTFANKPKYKNNTTGGYVNKRIQKDKHCTSHNPHNSDEENIIAGYISEDESMDENESTDEDDNNNTSKNITFKPDTPRFNPIGGAKKEDKKIKLQGIISNAYYLIINTRIGLLKRIKTIKINEIKSLLITAYKWVISLQIVEAENEYSKLSGSKQDISKNLADNPMFMYIWKIRNMIHKTNISDLKQIIGRTLDTIEKEITEKGLLETTPIVDKKTFDEHINMDHSDTDYNNIVTTYLYESYHNATKYFSGNIFKEYASPPSAVLVDYYQSWNSIDQIQHTMQYYNMIAKAPPIYIPNYRKYGNRFENDASIMKLDLAKIYRKNGTPHSWSIYVFAPKKTGKRKELTLKQIIMMLNNGEDIYKNYILVDKKDPITGEYLSKIKDYSKEIKSNMNKIEQRDNFFTYFQNRCPVSGLHEFNDNKICIKCKLMAQENWIATSDGTKYYDKYLPILEKQIRETNAIIKESFKEVDIYEQDKDKYNPFKNVKAPNFQLNEAKLLEVSRKIKIPYNILVNIGLTEGIKFDKIRLGELNPSKNIIEQDKTRQDKTKQDREHEEDNTVARILKLDSYYNNIIFQYYLLKNYETTYDLTLGLNELIDKQKTTKGLQKAMVDIYDPLYHTQLIYYMYFVNDPVKISNFILNKISETLLTILDGLTKNKFPIFGMDLIKFFMDNIIKQEELFSRPNPFKYTVDKREEYGNNYASNSEELDTDVTDVISEADFRTQSEVQTDSDVILEQESEDTGWQDFGYTNVDIESANRGEDDD